MLNVLHFDYLFSFGVKGFVPWIHLLFEWCLYDVYNACNMHLYFSNKHKLSVFAARSGRLPCVRVARSLWSAQYARKMISPLLDFCKNMCPLP